MKISQEQNGKREANRKTESKLAMRFSKQRKEEESMEASNKAKARKDERRRRGGGEYGEGRRESVNLD